MIQILRYIESNEAAQCTQITTFCYNEAGQVIQQVKQSKALFWDVVGDSIMDAVIRKISHSEYYEGICFLYSEAEIQNGEFYSDDILKSMLADNCFRSDISFRLRHTDNEEIRTGFGYIDDYGIGGYRRMAQDRTLPSFKEYLDGKRENESHKTGENELPGLSQYVKKKDADVAISPLKNGNNYEVTTAARHGILEYAHPLDSEIIDILDKPMINTAIAKIVQTSYDANYGLVLASGIHINQNTYPDLYRVIVECAETLNIPVPYAIISNSVSGINAQAAGTDQFSFVMISSMLPLVMNRDELKFVVGHELGHIALGHAIYHTAASLIGNAGAFLPIIGAYLTRTITYPLKAWSRRSEVSADRAGLLCCGDLKVAQKALYKLEAGFLGEGDVNIDEYIRESERLRNGTLLGKYSELKMEHPILPKRIKALELFANSKLYAKCIGIEPPKDWISKEKLDAETEKVLEIM